VIKEIDVRGQQRTTMPYKNLEKRRIYLEEYRKTVKWKESRKRYNKIYRDKHCHELSYKIKNRENGRKHYNKYHNELSFRKKHAGLNFTLKMQVIQKYGGKCVACGTEDISCLSFDHVNNGGNKLRRQGIDISGPSFFNDLLRSECRNDLQVLCMNCQSRKTKYGPRYDTWFAHPNNITTSHQIY
jgi:5-methylcytosine-specific restriction endonuclease McrA